MSWFVRFLKQRRQREDMEIDEAMKRAERGVTNAEYLVLRAKRLRELRENK